MYNVINSEFHLEWAEKNFQYGSWHFKDIWVDFRTLQLMELESIFQQ